MTKGGWQIRVGQVALVAVLILVWYLTATQVGTAFLPSPAAALDTLIRGMREGWLGPDLVTTLWEVLWGYLWAAGIGLIIGFSLGQNRLLREAYEGPLLSLYSIPKVTLFPIFLFLFKLGSPSKIAFGAFHGLFPIAIYTWTAMRTMNPVQLKVARALRLKPMATFTRVVVPSVLPAIVTGLRLGFNLTFLGVLLGEMFASRAGLGFLLMSFGAAFDMARIIAVILVVSLLALGLNGVLLAMERRIGRGGPEVPIG